MSQSFKIKKQPWGKKLICKHKSFIAWRIEEDTLNGTTLYKVCVKCGRIKKLKYITSEHYQDYEWSKIHLFSESEKSIKALVNDNFRRIDYE